MQSKYLLTIAIAVTCLNCATENNSIQTVVPENYTTLCVSCHGEDLKGAVAQSLVDGSWQFGARDGDLFRSIKFGHPQFGMPSWGTVLNDEQINDLVTFIRFREEESGGERSPVPESLETMDYLLDIKTITDSLDTPWGIAFSDEATMLITERPGRLRVVQQGVLSADPIGNTPAVLAEGQGGLLDVVLHPEYPENGWVYLSFSHAITSEQQDTLSFTSVVRGRIKEGKWTDQQTIYQADSSHYQNTRLHYGGRITFDHHGYLYLSIGDRGKSEDAQDLEKPNGKIHRFNADGSIPATNPFIGRTKVLPSIYSYGHRNPQGLTTHPETGEIWEAEHGPLGGDELNLIKAGFNYGWPKITHGINYNGQVISEYSRLDGMEQPALYWKPSIAVCGIDFYTGPQFPKWENQLLVGALRFEEVKLLDIENDRVIYQQTLLKNAGRVRIARPGPDGAIYLVLNRPDMIVRLSPTPDS